MEEKNTNNGVVVSATIGMISLVVYLIAMPLGVYLLQLFSLAVSAISFLVLAYFQFKRESLGFVIFDILYALWVIYRFLTTLINH